MLSASRSSNLSASQGGYAEPTVGENYDDVEYSKDTLGYYSQTLSTDSSSYYVADHSVWKLFMQLNDFQIDAKVDIAEIPQPEIDDDSDSEDIVEAAGFINWSKEFHALLALQPESDAERRKKFKKMTQLSKAFETTATRYGKEAPERVCDRYKEQSSSRRRSFLMTRRQSKPNNLVALLVERVGRFHCEN